MHEMLKLCKSLHNRVYSSLFNNLNSHLQMCTSTSPASRPTRPRLWRWTSRWSYWSLRARWRRSAASWPASGDSTTRHPWTGTWSSRTDNIVDQDEGMNVRIVLNTLCLKTINNITMVPNHFNTRLFVYLYFSVIQVIITRPESIRICNFIKLSI